MQLYSGAASSPTVADDGSGFELELEVSLVEIYNDVLKDLLAVPKTNNGSPRKTPDLRVVTNSRGQTEVAGAVKVRVT